VLDLILPHFRLLMFHLPWSMVLRRLLLDGLLFLLRLVLLSVATILGVVWKERTPALVVSMLVEVVVREEWIVVIGHACRRAGGVYSRSASPIEMQHANTLVVAPHRGITALIPVEDVVIEPRCSPGSPGVEFVEGSSEGKVEGTTKYVPCGTDEMAADPYDHDSLDKDTLEDLTLSWRHGVGWSEERAACRGSGWE
jgi:hypothetical protein